MAFMKPQYCKGDWIEVEGSEGTTFLPADLVGLPDDWSFVSNRYRITNRGDDGFDTVAAFYEEYTLGGLDSISAVSYVAGMVGCRLSAPGYLDCTEWSIFATEREAREWITETYDVDPDTGDSLDED